MFPSFCRMEKIPDAGSRLMRTDAAPTVPTAVTVISERRDFGCATRQLTQMHAKLKDVNSVRFMKLLESRDKTGIFVPAYGSGLII
jgi:hypothetical protein